MNRRLFFMPRSSSTGKEIRNSLNFKNLKFVTFALAAAAIDLLLAGCFNFLDILNFVSKKFKASYFLDLTPSYLFYLLSLSLYLSISIYEFDTTWLSSLDLVFNFTHTLWVFYGMHFTQLNPHLTSIFYFYFLSLATFRSLFCLSLCLTVPLNHLSLTIFSICAFGRSTF